MSAHRPPLSTHILKVTGSTPTLVVSEPGFLERVWHQQTNMCFLLQPNLGHLTSLHQQRQWHVGYTSIRSNSDLGPRQHLDGNSCCCWHGFGYWCYLDSSELYWLWASTGCWMSFWVHVLCKASPNDMTNTCRTNKISQSLPKILHEQQPLSDQTVFLSH